MRSSAEQRRRKIHLHRDGSLSGARLEVQRPHGDIDPDPDFVLQQQNPVHQSELPGIGTAGGITFQKRIDKWLSHILLPLGFQDWAEISPSLEILLHPLTLFGV